MTRVLPLPAPARINNGPAPCVTAARWSSVRSARRALGPAGSDMANPSSFLPGAFSRSLWFLPPVAGVILEVHANSTGARHGCEGQPIPADPRKSLHYGNPRTRHAGNGVRAGAAVDRRTRRRVPQAGL